MSSDGSAHGRFGRYLDPIAQWTAAALRAHRDATFVEEGRARCRRGLQVFCAFALALLVASAVETWVGDPDRFGVLLRIRLLALGGLIAIFAIVRTQTGERHPRGLALAFLVLWTTMMHLLAVETGGQSSPQYDRMNLLVLGMAVMLTWPAVWAALGCGLVLLVYLAGTAAADGLGAPGVTQNLASLVASSVVTVAATAIREQVRWRAFRDLRAVKEADARRYETEERYRLLVETAGSAIFMLAPDRRIVEFNREAEILYGCPREEVVGRDYSEVFLPEPRRAEARRLFDRVLAGESIHAIEGIVRSRSGERRVVLWNVSRVAAGGAHPLGVIAVGHDITERKRAEEEVQRLNDELEHRVQARTAELRLSEERFRAIFESAPIGILTADRTGRVRHANRALEAMLGYSLAELRQRTLADLTVESDRARAQGALQKLCDQGGSELQIDRRYRSRDGTLVWAHEAFAVVRDPHGEFDYVLGMVENVTDRQRAEERAREHQEHLAHVLRVSTMGEMAAELAHELNQPLGAIVNFANGTLVRLRSRGIEPEIERAVVHIASEGLRAGEIIRRIRDFVRQGDSHREQSDVNHLVRQAAYLLEPDARGRGIPVRLALDDTLPPVEVDRIQVEQVVLNLIRNAIDAIGVNHRSDDEVLLRTHRAEGAIAVTVRDSGIGPPPNAGDRIFDAFFTTKRGGLGMGLSISRSIIEAHGGRLWAADNPDRGMSFTFELPLDGYHGEPA
jgi:PAS domain S-box-containing protein